MTLKKTNITILDCTLRDGGYYNNWNFSTELVNRYLIAMKEAQVDVVELGFRSLKNEGFKGPYAFTTDDFIQSLDIPSDLTICVMVNASDLCADIGWKKVMEKLFPMSSDTARVDMVRFACHYHELGNALLAANWLIERGYRVGLNLMQIVDCTQADIRGLGKLASKTNIEVLYFADSMGSMLPREIKRIVGWLRESWSGAIGIHTHDNMRLALQNTLNAQAHGVNWLDATITGMGRGPGNARIEEVLIETEALRGRKANIIPLMSLIRSDFSPMKNHFGWGTNTYYYLAGKHGIHPSYIQEMLRDGRYEDEDILAVIDYLREEGGKKFSLTTLNGARQFFHGEPRGTWSPETVIKNREMLILGSGPSVLEHSYSLKSYIKRARPLVIALNTQEFIDQELIDFRIACHPVRLLADVHDYLRLPQPLIIPVSMLSESLIAKLNGKVLLDYGLGIEDGRFAFFKTHCIAPSPLVLAYALAVAKSGKASRIIMAGFDGFERGDVRNDEVETIFSIFKDSDCKHELFSVTPTKYKNLPTKSIYALG